MARQLDARHCQEWLPHIKLDQNPSLHWYFLGCEPSMQHIHCTTRNFSDLVPPPLQHKTIMYYVSQHHGLYQRPHHPMPWAQATETNQCYVHSGGPLHKDLKLKPNPYPKDPSIQIIPTLGPNVCRYYLHWAIWIPMDNFNPDIPTRCPRPLKGWSSPPPGSITVFLIRN